jgi:hypothetical protein
MRDQSRRALPGDVWVISMLLIVGLTTGAWAIDPPLASVGLASIEFSVGTTAPGIGLAGSGVALEAAAEAVGLDPVPGRTEDDIYFQSYVPPGAFPYTNYKLFDDGGGTAGTPPLPPLDLTIRTNAGGPVDTTDVDAYAIMNWNGMGPGMFLSIEIPASVEGTYIQFSVDSNAVGLPGPPPCVNSEALGGEAQGDVFESGPIAYGGPAPASNVLISDEGAHGLAVTDDLDGLIVNDPSMSSGGVWIDTDGDGLLDMPVVRFCFNPAAGLPATVASGADICVPGTGAGGPAADPAVNIPFVALGLQATDNIDALWMDGIYDVLFSLDPFSPSLAAPSPVVNPFVGAGSGCDPGDIIHVSLFAPVPTVAILSTQLGLVSDGLQTWPDLASDNLDALWVTGYPVAGELVPVELSVLTAD